MSICPYLSFFQLCIEIIYTWSLLQFWKSTGVTDNNVGSILVKGLISNFVAIAV